MGTSGGFTVLLNAVAVQWFQILVSRLDLSMRPKSWRTASRRKCDAIMSAIRRLGFPDETSKRAELSRTFRAVQYDVLQIADDIATIPK